LSGKNDARSKKNRFRSLNLLAPLVGEVEEIIKQVPLYKNVPEFVSEAIRLRLFEMWRLHDKKEGNN